MEQHVGLIVLEHLSHQFDIHVLDVDLLYFIEMLPITAALGKGIYLQLLVHHHDGFVEFLLLIISMLGRLHPWGIG